MNSLTRSLLIFFLGLISLTAAYSQDNSYLEYLNNLDIYNLNDEQVESFLKKVDESGYSLQEIESIAIMRGVEPAKIEQLNNRIELYRNNEIKTLQDKMRDSIYRKDTGKNGVSGTDVLDGIRKDKSENFDENKFFASINKKDAERTVEDSIFGLKLFRNEKISFEPGQNFPVPENYLLGQGDIIQLNIWGVSEYSYKLEISPEGKVIIPNVGSVLLSGITIAEARKKLHYELGRIYSGMKGSNPSTFMELSLAQSKSIEVNMVGEIKVPGTYTLSSFASIFNALYAAGGPSVTGSLRSIRLIRNGKTIQTVDMYGFLLYGELKSDFNLRDQDVIFVDPYKSRIQITGEIKRPGYYEILENENLSSLISYAGGFTGKAYEGKVTVIRKTDKENRILDCRKEDYDVTALHNGDKITIEPILDRFENRIEITGAVYRPGLYSLDNNPTLRDLIRNADGLRGDAFPNRGVIYRQKEDMTLEVVSFSLADINDNSRSDIILKREDIVSIPSIFDLKEEYTINIFGDVKKPGTYLFTSGSELEDVIVLAGGLLESASQSRIEIARRIKDPYAERKTSKVSEIFQFPVNPDLSISAEASSFELQPFDNIYVRRSPAYEVQKNVVIEGEVEFPGEYSLSQKDDNLSSLILRAGGLTEYAYAPGARLVRQLTSQEVKEKETIEKLAVINSDTSDFKLQTEQAIGIDLVKVLANPGSKYDLAVMEGDRIVIPRKLMTVKMEGGVLYSTTERYDQNNSFLDYISGAGGFSENAKRKKSYIIYANGSVGRTRSFMGIKNYPRVEPGAIIYVPERNIVRRLSIGETISIATAISSMSLVLVTLINTIKP